MTTEPSQNTLPSVTDPDQHNQMLGQAAFWLPRHMARSTLLGQLPFLFWLTETVSPRMIVQLGTGDGVGYLALCQAAERLNLGTVCLAMEPGKIAMLAALRTAHDTHYTDFSRLSSGENMANGLPAGASIDLLVLNTPPDRETLALLRDEIIPRLSDRAVVLVSDPDTVLADQSARKLLTGKGQPAMTMAPVVPNGVAVELILYGSTQHDRLRRLVAQQPGQSSWLTLRQAFNRLGQGLAATQRNQELSQEQADRKAPLAEADAALAALKTQLEQAQASEKSQMQRQAEMAAMVHDLQQAAKERDALLQERDALQQERDALTLKLADQAETRTLNEADRAELEELRQIRAKAEAQQAEIGELRKALDSARAEHEARIDDIVVLTSKYHADIAEAEKKTATRLAQTTKQANERVAAITKQADERVAQSAFDLSAITAHRDALLASTSWKITSPLRKVTKAVRGR